jgi:heme-degrading monooxygenase HmoA
VLARRKDIKIIKACLPCRYLKGSSLRIIYTYWESRNSTEFIQLYFKSDEERVDYGRIKDYMDEVG